MSDGTNEVGKPPMTILLGVLREKPVRITEKLSKAKPAIKKGGSVGGYPRSCFGQRFYLAPSCDQDTNVS